MAHRVLCPSDMKARIGVSNPEPPTEQFARRSKERNHGMKVKTKIKAGEGGKVRDQEKNPGTGDQTGIPS